MQDGNNFKVYNDPNGLYTRNHSDGKPVVVHRPEKPASIPVKKPQESGAAIYVNQKLNEMLSNIDNIETRIASINTSMDSLDERLQVEESYLDDEIHIGSSTPTGNYKVWIDDTDPNNSDNENNTLSTE